MERLRATKNDHTAAACKNPASLAVALNCGMGSSSSNALVKALDKLQSVRAWNSFNRRVKIQIVDGASEVLRHFQVGFYECAVDD